MKKKIEPDELTSADELNSDDEPIGDVPPISFIEPTEADDADNADLAAVTDADNNEKTQRALDVNCEDEDGKDAECEDADGKDKDCAGTGNEGKETEELFLSLLKAALAIVSGKTTEADFKALADAATATMKIEELAAQKASEIDEAYRKGLIDGRNDAIKESFTDIIPELPDVAGQPMPMASQPLKNIFDLAATAR